MDREEHPSAARDIAERFDHIVVDEFQDLSPVQLGVVERLWEHRTALADPAEPPAQSGDGDGQEHEKAEGDGGMGAACPSSLLVVGDDEQAIFQWRMGAAAAGQGAGVATAVLERWRADHPHASGFRLDRSYRAKPRLQQAADRLLGRQLDATPESSAAGNDGVCESEGRVERERFETAAEEAAWIAERIERAVASSDGVRLNDFAVLCRHNHEAKRFGTALAAAGIPTNVVGGTTLFDQPRVAEMLHLLAALVQWPGHGCYHLYSLLAAASTARLQPVANSAQGCLADMFGMPLPLLTALMSHANQDKAPLRRVIEEAAHGPRSQALCEQLTAVCGVSTPPDSAHEILRSLHLTLADYEGRVHTMPPSLLLSRLLEESGMAAAYAVGEQDDAAAVGRFLRYLAQLEKDQTLTGGGATEWAAATFLVPYLHSLREAGEEPGLEEHEGSDGTPGDGLTGTVAVLTIHKAKGLEWPHIFLACATQSHLGGGQATALRRRRQPLGADIPIPQAHPSTGVSPVVTGAGAVQDGAASEIEARRLFYVAMTRARESITFTSARHYGGAFSGTAMAEADFVALAMGAEPEQ